MNNEAVWLNTLEQKIHGVIVRYGMLPQGCTVIAGLSGGADSLALTHFLFRHAAQYGIMVVAAHVNHGMRGAESDADEAFVRSWCAENGVGLRVLRADVPALASQRGLGLEECGREVRYEFFRSLTGVSGIARIATAHTLSDSAETVLMNLARGAGMRGLCGIPPVRGDIVRPLIEVTRAQTESYCVRYGLSYVTDSTNAERSCARNVLRLDAVPAMKQVNPTFEQAVLRMTDSLRQDEEYLSGQALGALKKAAVPGGWKLSELCTLPQPLLVRAVGIALRHTTPCRQESRHLLAAAVCVRNGGEITACGGVRLRAANGLLTIWVPKPPAEAFKTALTLPKTVLPGGRTLFICEMPEESVLKKDKFNNLLFHNLINYATIENDICARNRREGDVFCPAGRGVTKTLKKLFNEAKIPPERRGSLVLLESGGKIVWIEGFGPSQSACPQKGQRVGKIIIKESAYHDS